MTEIKPLTEDMIPAAASLERECLDTAWSERTIRDFLASETAVYLYAERDGRLCGVISASVVCGEAEIENLAVAPWARRSGVASALVGSITGTADKVFLLVRRDNGGARAFYQAAGFTENGIRRGFYGGTDAIFMEMRNGEK